MVELDDRRPKPEPDEPGPTELATRSKLESIGQTATPGGAAAIVLARKLDAGVDTGSAMASVSRELRTLIAEARAEGQAPAGSIVDELRLARERMRGA